MTYIQDLSEFNVNVMTGNNGAHQRSPHDPGIQKLPFFFVQTPQFCFTYMELMIKLANDNFIEVKKILGSGQKRKAISEPLGHKENVCCWYATLFPVMTLTLNSDRSIVLCSTIKSSLIF